MNQSSLPVVVIGAGPIGLAAAAHLFEQGQTPLVFEAGDAVGASIREWGHVRLFSPWRYLIDAAAQTLLVRHGWAPPDPESYPTGHDLIDRYLAPLAATPELASSIRLHQRVVSVTRQGFDKMKTSGREAAPFLLTIRSTEGQEETILARAVIDASGTWQTPNPLGASGVPAQGEAALAEQIFYGIPDVLATHRARYAGRRILVVGSGHSAFNVLLDLSRLAQEEPSTQLVWVVRRATLGQLFGGGEEDALPARGTLGTRMRQLVDEGRLNITTGFQVAALTATKGGIILSSEREVLPPVDEIIATTGFRPDLTLLRELRLHLDPALESPAALAPLIDPNIHSCGTVPPHGAIELAHPEADFFIVGMKSYGRAPTFLTLTGYEQVRSVTAALVGDLETAREVHLVLPKTGVCSSTRGDDTGCEPAGGEQEAQVSSSGYAADLVPVGVSSTAVCCG